MLARLKLSDAGYGKDQEPTGEIEVWCNDKMEWRLATPDETVPALIEIVADLWRWKQKVIGQ